MNQTVAGVFALLNDFRLSQGKATLGFVNPLLYSTASSGFNDITAGTNPGCGTTGKLMVSHRRFWYF
jgi:tripeptidyl-peptidase-1